MSALPDADIEDVQQPQHNPEPPAKKRRKRKRTGQRRPGAGATVPGAARRREQTAVRLHCAQRAFAAAVAAHAPVTLHGAWTTCDSGRAPPTLAAAHHALAAVLTPLLVPSAGAAPVTAHRQAAAFASTALDACARTSPLARSHAALLLLRAWTRRVPEQLMGSSTREWVGGAHDTLGTAELVAWVAGLGCARVLRATLRAVLVASTVPREHAAPVVDAAVHDIHSVSSSLVLAYHDSAAHRDFCTAVGRVRDVFAPDADARLASALQRLAEATSDDAHEEEQHHQEEQHQEDEDAGYGARVARAAAALVREVIRTTRRAPAMALTRRWRACPLQLVADLADDGNDSARKVLFGDAPDRTGEEADARLWMESVQRVCTGGKKESSAEDAQRLVDTLARDGVAALLRAQETERARTFCDAVADYAARAFVPDDAVPFHLGCEDLLQRLLPEPEPELQSALNRLGDSPASVRALVRCSLFSRRAVVRGVLALAWRSDAPGILDALAPLLAHDTSLAAHHAPLDALRELVSCSDANTGPRLAKFVTALDHAALVPRRALTAWLVDTLGTSSTTAVAAGECASTLFTPDDAATDAAVNLLLQQGTNGTAALRDVAQTALGAFAAASHASNVALVEKHGDSSNTAAQLLLCSYQEPLPPSLITCATSEVAAAAHPLRCALRITALAGTNARTLAEQLRSVVPTPPREPPVLALAAVLAGASAREFAACTAAATTLVPTADDAPLPQLLFQAFWFAHEPSTRALVRGDEQDPPPCLCGACDAATAPGPQPCAFLPHLVHALQTFPCTTTAEALACHRSACLLHRHCGTTQHRLATLSLCVATQRTALAQHAAPADIRILQQQCGITADAELVALLSSSLEHSQP